MANPNNTPVSISNLKAWSSSIPSGNELMYFNPCGELEDLIIRVGSFKNAGVGWNTFTFPEPFESTPIVMCQCDGYTVDIKNITMNSFLYKVVKTSIASMAQTTKTLYEYNSNTSSTGNPYVYAVKSGYYTKPFTVLTGSNITGGDQTVETGVEIKWVAIEYTNKIPTGRYLNYIQSTGQQWINTNYHPNPLKTRIETKFAITKPDSTVGIFGCRPNGSIDSESFSVYYNANDNKRLRLDSIGQNVASQEILIDSDVTLSSFDKIATVNDQKFSSSTTRPDKVLSQNVYIFNVHFIDKPYATGAPGNECVSMKLYYFKIYENDILKHDLVPYLNDEKEAGLLDLVSNVFYKNSGTGEFLYG